MKRITILLMLLLPSLCLGQAVRYNGNIYTINTSSPQPGGLYPVLANTTATVQICTYSTTQTCPALTTTYTNSAQSVSCPTTAQLTPSNSGACTSSVDATGSFGAWLVAGNYQYMVNTTYGTFGPYDISIGGASASSGCTSSGASGVLQAANGSGGCIAVPADYGISSALSFNFHPGHSFYAMIPNGFLFNFYDPSGNGTTFTASATSPEIFTQLSSGGSASCNPLASGTCLTIDRYPTGFDISSYPTLTSTPSGSHYNEFNFDQYGTLVYTPDFDVRTYNGGEVSLVASNNAALTTETEIQLLGNLTISPPSATGCGNPGWICTSLTMNWHGVFGEHPVFKMDATSGALTDVLPSASGPGNIQQSSILWLYKVDSTGNSVTLSAAAGQTVNNASSITLTTQGQMVELISDGKLAWYVAGGLGGSCSDCVITDPSSDQIISQPFNTQFSIVPAASDASTNSGLIVSSPSGGGPSITMNGYIYNSIWDNTITASTFTIGSSDLISGNIDPSLLYVTDATSNSITVTLNPFLSGAIFTIKREDAGSDSNIVTISPGGGGTIDGGSTITLANHNSVTLMAMSAGVWVVTSTNGSGGGGSGCASSGSQGVVQAAGATSGTCEPTAITDNGTTVTSTEPISVPSATFSGSGIPIATGTTSNTDLAGFITLSGGTGTYTFSSTHVSAPVCVATDTTTAAAVKASASTTVLTLTGTSTDVIAYICMGRT